MPKGRPACYAPLSEEEFRFQEGKSDGSEGINPFPWICPRCGELLQEMALRHFCKARARVLHNHVSVIQGGDEFSLDYCRKPSRRAFEA